MRLGDFIAYMFSVILNPLLMPLYSVLLLFSYTNFSEIYPGQIFNFLFPVFLFSCLIPALFIFVLKKTGMVKDYSLSNRFERIIPYIMTCFSNSTLVYYFYSSNLYIWFLGVLAVPAIITLVGFLINIFWKVSAHMLAIGGLIGVTLAVCYHIKGLNPFLLFIMLFILAGCLAVSRLYLKKSTVAQVYGGFLIGVAVAFSTIWININISY